MAKSLWDGIGGPQHSNDVLHLLREVRLASTTPHQRRKAENLTKFCIQVQHRKLQVCLFPNPKLAQLPKKLAVASDQRWQRNKHVIKH